MNESCGSVYAANCRLVGFEDIKNGFMREGWEYKKLGEVAQVVSGATPKTNVEEYWGEGHYWVTPAELNDTTVVIYDTERQITDKALEKIKLQLLPKGTVLLSSRAPIGKVAICGVDMYCNQGFKNCICSDAIYNKFLFYFLKDRKGYLNSLGRGATFKEISKSIVEKVEIPLPPMSVQLEIVSELDQINELIRLKKELLKDYDNLAPSIFYEMFGDPVENDKGWDVKKLGDIAAFKNGLNFGKAEKGITYKFLGVSDFQDNTFVCSDRLGTIELSQPLSEEYLLEEGDIVFVRSNGSKELVGRNVLLHISEPTTYSGFCIRCRLTVEGWDPVFLSFLLKTPSMRPLITNSGRGCNISNLNQKILGALPVIDVSFEKQQEFSSLISRIERLKAGVSNAIADLETLLASRMQYWFE